MRERERAGTNDRDPGARAKSESKDSCVSAQETPPSGLSIHWLSLPRLRKMFSIQMSSWEANMTQIRYLGVMQPAKHFSNPTAPRQVKEDQKESSMQMLCPVELECGNLIPCGNARV